MAKILIVDDDLDIVEAMRVVLAQKGYEVIVAADGVEGINKFKQEKPDLIILDVMMPNMDGFEVSRRIRKEETGKSVPIIMLTAIKDKMGLDFKKEAGDKDWLPVDDYCEKPIDHLDLISKIENLLKVT